MREDGSLYFERKKNETRIFKRRGSCITFLPLMLRPPTDLKTSRKSRRLAVGTYLREYPATDHEESEDNRPTRAWCTGHQKRLCTIQPLIYYIVRKRSRQHTRLSITLGGGVNCQFIAPMVRTWIKATTIRDLDSIGNKALTIPRLRVRYDRL